MSTYTSRGHGCGLYSELIFVESKALKQLHSLLCACFSNAAIGKNKQIENRNGGRAKYISIPSAYGRFNHREYRSGTHPIFGVLDGVRKIRPTNPAPAQWAA